MKEILESLLVFSDVRLDVELKEEAKKSGCVFKKNIKSVIYLSTEEDINKRVLILAHEVSHLINYKKRKSNYTFLKFLDFTRKIVTIIGLLYPLCFIFMKFQNSSLSYISLLLSLILAISILICYLKYYVKDEVSAELGAIDLLTKLANEGSLKNMFELSIVKEYSENRINDDIKKFSKEVGLITSGLILFLNMLIVIFSMVIIKR